MTLARGIRNRNPVNIEHRDYNDWIGLADPPSDGRYCKFIHPIYGYRAALYIMTAYRRRGLFTLEQVIREWAPAADYNPTDEYIRVVCEHSGASKNEHVLRSIRIPEILAGMTVFECGTQPYSRLIFEAAVDLWRYEKK